MRQKKGAGLVSFYGTMAFGDIIPHDDVSDTLLGTKGIKGYYNEHITQGSAPVLLFVRQNETIPIVGI